MARSTFGIVPVCLLVFILITNVACQSGGVLEGIHNFVSFLHSLGGLASRPPPPVSDSEDRWGRGLCNNQCTCGVPNRMTRIIGGEATQVNEYPWVVALTKNGKVFCGGTLISDLHVLTAAHCVDKNIYMLRMATWVVLAGHYTVSVVGSSSYVQRRQIYSVVKHPKFRPLRGNMDNDIGLIVLNARVEFNSVVLAPACLPSPGEDFANRRGTVVGWGRQREKGSPATELRSVQVPILSQEDCRSKTLYGGVNVTNNMMCAGRITGGVDSCQGDSGGALMVVDHMKRLVVAGIVSWGEGCGRPFRPGVYTRVNRYLEWIQSNTRDSCFCA